MTKEMRQQTTQPRQVVGSMGQAGAGWGGGGWGVHGGWDLTSSCLQCNGCSDSPVIGNAILLQLLQPTPQG